MVSNTLYWLTKTTRKCPKKALFEMPKIIYYNPFFFLENRKKFILLWLDFRSEEFAYL
jgi:hypothetical protein